MKLTDQELKAMFGDTPDSFSLAMERALAGEASASQTTPRRLSKTWIVVLLVVLALALTTGGYAAALRLGLLDMLARNSLGPVPQAAQELLAQSEMQTYEVGPMTVSFNESMVDGYVAYMIFQSRMTDGSEALLINWTDSFYLPVPGCYQGRAKAYGLPEDPRMGLLAARWEGPIYSVSTRLHIDHAYMKGEEMIMDNEWGPDGSILTGGMFELDPDAVGDTLPATLSVRAEEITVTGPYNPESASCPIEQGQAWLLEIPIELPVHGAIETREYALESDGDLDFMTVTGMALERTGVELYAHIHGTVTDEDREPYGFPWLELTDGEGESLPEGMLETFYVDSDRWPEVTLTLSLALDEFPAAVKIPYQDREVTLRIKDQ